MRGFRELRYAPILIMNLSIVVIILTGVTVRPVCGKFPTGNGNLRRVLLITWNLRPVGLNQLHSIDRMDDY